MIFLLRISLFVFATVALNTKISHQYWIKLDMLGNCVRLFFSNLVEMTFREDFLFYLFFVLWQNAESQKRFQRPPKRKCLVRKNIPFTYTTHPPSSHFKYRMRHNLIRLTGKARDGTKQELNSSTSAEKTFSTVQTLPFVPHDVFLRYVNLLIALRLSISSINKTQQLRLLIYTFSP